MTYAGPRYDESDWEGSVRNGAIPPDRLREVEAWPVPYDRDLNGPARAHPEAAAACGVLLRSAWEAGRTGLTIAYSYRTLDAQENKWQAYQNGTGNLAARPGTSNHGWARSFDMRWSNASEYTYLHANAGRCGFVFDVRGENWHMTLQEGKWKGDDMTKDEKEMLEAARLWAAGEEDYREAYQKKGSDPGPPPDNFKAPRKKGWQSARFSVQRITEHLKEAPHKAA